MQGSGYLAIWSDLAPEHETDWMHWMTREHSSERVGVEGFLACRIFRAYGLGVRRYFILYEWRTPRWSAGPTIWRGSMRRRRGRSASCRS